MVALPFAGALFFGAACGLGFATVVAGLAAAGALVGGAADAGFGLALVAGAAGAEGALDAGFGLALVAGAAGAAGVAGFAPEALAAGGAAAA